MPDRPLETHDKIPARSAIFAEYARLSDRHCLKGGHHKAGEGSMQQLETGKQVLAARPGRWSCSSLPSVAAIPGASERELPPWNSLEAFFP